MGVAAAAGIALAATISPRWRAAGLPYFDGYGKNVEAAAVAGALAAGAATQWFVRSRRGLAACLLAALCGLALAAWTCSPEPLVAGWPRLLAVAGLATALGVGRRGGVGAGVASLANHVDQPSQAKQGSHAARKAGGGDVPVLVAVLAVGALAGAAFAVTAGAPAMGIDVYHVGEVLSTALDLVRGGRPFKTLIWPHGASDTGLAALWILATGKVGTSPVALQWALRCGLGVVAAYVLARRLLGSRGEALAACLAAALAPLLFEQPPLGANVWALSQLGALVFVVLGFAAVTSPRHDLAAGLCFGLAYLFRIETGLYGVVAAVAVIAARNLLAAGEPLARTVKTAAAGVLRLLAGAAVVLAAARLVLGWPGAEWFAYTLRDLPRYHADAVGIPLPWPRRNVELSPGEIDWLSLALARLLLTLLLLVQALRGLLARPRSLLPAEPERRAQVLFVALFAAASAKSALDRSDVNHVLHWSTLPLLAAALLAVARWRERRSWGRLRSSVAVLVMVALLDFHGFGFRFPSPRSAAAVAALARERWQATVEHLAPNPPVGACVDRMFTPGESRLAANRDFIDASCAVETMLRSHGVSRLMVADGAPWHYVRFRSPFPTRFFAVARAYTPPRQRELIDELRRSRPQALLLAHGYGALAGFDIPDAVRVPVVDAYLRGRRHGVAVTPTPLGDLFFWDEPGECGPAAPDAQAAPAGGAATRAALPGGRSPLAVVTADLAAFQPASGLLFAQGWATDGAAKGPLAGLLLRNAPPGADFEYGLERDGAAEALRHAGWELRVRGWLPGGTDGRARDSSAAAGGAPGTARGPGKQQALVLDAVAAGGRVVRVRLELPAARRLGPLRGAEWQGMGAAIDRAGALGRADRADALGRAAGAHRVAAFGAASGQEPPLPCEPREGTGERP